MQKVERAAVILELADQLSRRGSWCGETHLQKTAYFLQALLGVPMGFDFILYKHGPFSFELRDDVGTMVAHTLLDVRLHPAPYGPSLAPSPLGEGIKEGLSQQYQKKVTFVAEHLADKGVVDLERLGTALFVTLENESASPNQRARRMTDLKPHIAIEDALEALEEVDDMRDELAPRD